MINIRPINKKKYDINYKLVRSNHKPGMIKIAKRLPFDLKDYDDYPNQRYNSK